MVNVDPVVALFGLSCCDVDIACRRCVAAFSETDATLIEENRPGLSIGWRGFPSRRLMLDFTSIYRLRYQGGAGVWQHMF